MVAVRQMDLLGTHEISADPAQVRQARHQARHLAEQATGDEDTLYNLGLLLSEAITNATLHGTAPITIHVRRSRPRQILRVEVIDKGSRDQSTDSRVDYGRGFQVIEGLAAAWHLDLRLGETVCWFEMQIP